jgi:7,8-dihydro-6-hydroxymethylpterin-pyrophosphokinase
MKTLKELRKERDISWVNYFNACLKDSTSEECEELKEIFKKLENQLDNQKKV